MAKYYGKVGYGIEKETAPGVWELEFIERDYSGDVLKNYNAASQSSGNLNDNINISMNISIVADPYATENFSTIKYVTYMGAKWKVTNAEVQHPRIVLSIGGVFNAY